MLSIVIPTLNEAGQIQRVLQSIEPLSARVPTEVLVIDGGSSDGTTQLAKASSARVLCSSTGRAIQMNTGATHAVGKYLLFLHADTCFSQPAASALVEQTSRGAIWGRFDVQLSGSHPLLRVVETSMNLRSRLTGIATGDQALFARRDAFWSVGGYPPIPLMEDIVLSRRLKGLAPPVCLRQRVMTSSRRWEHRGVWRTIVQMWHLRLRFFFGADPVQLARDYNRDQ